MVASLQLAADLPALNNPHAPQPTAANWLMNDSGTNQPSTTLAAAVAAHRAGNLAQADLLYRQVLQQDPGNADVFHSLGLVTFQMNRLEGAVEWMRQAIERIPSNPDYRTNLGTVLQAQGRLDEAIEQFRAALGLDPNSWRLHYNVANALQAQGALDAAVQEYEIVLLTKPDCVEALTNLGSVLLQQSRLDAAIQCLQTASQLKPDSIIVQYNLAKALHQDGQLDAAVRNYREVIHRQPDFVDAQVQLARALADCGELDSAIQCLRQTLIRKPKNGKVLRLLSQLLRDNGEFEAAIDCIRTIISMDEQSAEAHYNLGLTLEDQGQLDEAIECYRQTLRYEPNFTQALVGEAGILEKKGDIQRAYEIVRPMAEANDADIGASVLYAKLIRQLGQPQDAIDRLQQVLRRDELSTTWRIIAHTDLGQAYNGLGQYEKAYAQYRQANELKPGRFDAQRHERMIDKIIDAFSRGTMRSLPRSSNCSKIPVFIVGMPRSGTSLVEQILASHPRIFGAGELMDMEQMTQSLPQTLGSRTSFPECIGEFTQQTADDLAGTYVARLREFSSTAARVTDKMPHNYLHVGFIRLLFPSAPIIHCRRDPRDTCLSCYFANFLASQTFANDLDALAAYFVQYEKLMRHWTKTLEVPMFEVCYEQLVREPEAICRTLVAYLELEWDERCLQFHRSKRFMNTASYRQVRQPIYTKSVGRWRHYEQFLGRLLNMLE